MSTQDQSYTLTHWMFCIPRSGLLHYPRVPCGKRYVNHIVPIEQRQAAVVVWLPQDMRMSCNGQHLALESTLAHLMTLYCVCDCSCMSSSCQSPRGPAGQDWKTTTFIGDVATSELRMQFTDVSENLDGQSVIYPDWIRLSILHSIVYVPCTT